ncbi:histone-like nucleoid-structuring protein Lsr2 [Streptomyces sp. NPDC048491]|uniref:Lsr2 family DNA-binding protein n=1 Tax=Streptomyces sp. NPDC048491 TaxID=3157207 RepID=UPI003426C1E9
MFDALGLLMITDVTLRQQPLVVLVPSLRDVESPLAFLSGRDSLTGTILSAVAGSSGFKEMSPAQLEQFIELPRGAAVDLMAALLRASAFGSKTGVSRIDLAAIIVEWFTELSDSSEHFLRVMQSEGTLHWFRALAVKEHAAHARMAEAYDKVLAHFDSASRGSLRYAVSAFDESIRYPVRKETLLTRNAWLASDLSGDGFTILSLLAGMRNEWQSEDGWFSQKTLSRVKQETCNILDLEEGEVMSLDTADRLLRASQIYLHAEDLEAWLDYCNILDEISGLVSWAEESKATRQMGEPQGSVLLPEPASGDSRATEDLPPEPREPAVPSASPHSNFDETNQGVSLLQSASDMNSIIRSWARSQGYEIGERGRISSPIRAAFEAASRSPEGITVPAGMTFDLPPRHRVEVAQEESLVDILGALSKLAQESFPKETLGSLLGRSSDLDDRFVALIEKLLRARVDPGSVGGWVSPAEGLEEPYPGKPSGYVSLRDRAFAALREMQCPLSIQRLADCMDGKVNINSLRVQIASDRRFVRSDIDAWSLADWGLRPYRSIKDLISEELDLAGGEIPAEELVALLTTQFSIKEMTLRQMASRPPFTSRNGTVRRLADFEGHNSVTVKDDTEQPSQSFAIDLLRDMGLDF